MTRLQYVRTTIRFVALYVVLTITGLYRGRESFLQYFKCVGASLIEEGNVRGSSDSIVGRNKGSIASQGTRHEA